MRRARGSDVRSPSASSQCDSLDTASVGCRTRKARARCSSSAPRPCAASGHGSTRPASRGGRCSGPCAAAGIRRRNESPPGRSEPSSPREPRRPASRAESPGIHSGSGPRNRSRRPGPVWSRCRTPADGSPRGCSAGTRPASSPAVALSPAFDTGRHPPRPPASRHQNRQA